MARAPLPSLAEAAAEKARRKDLWDKADILGKLLASILIPVGIAVAGFLFNMSVQERANKEKIVEIAINVLQSDNTTTPELKSWAKGIFYELLDDANRALPAAARKELDQAPLPSGGSSAVVPSSPSSLEQFFARYRQEFGTIDPETASNLTQIFKFIDMDKTMQDVRQVAYVLATIRFESAGSFRSLKQICPGNLSDAGMLNACNDQYYGRGYIQLTSKQNYQSIGDKIGVDLVKNPDKALEPEIAYRITSAVMMDGMATGHKLDDFIHDEIADYFNARKIVSGLDHADTIATDAKKFESILREINSTQGKDSPTAPPPTAAK